jgi:hypothetical protein
LWGIFPMTIVINMPIRPHKMGGPKRRKGESSRLLG